MTDAFDLCEDLARKAMGSPEQASSPLIATCPVPGVWVELARFATDEDFDGWFAAEGYVLTNEWSIGPMQGSEPVGVLAEDGVSISKWRHLTRRQREELDGVIVFVSELDGPPRPRDATAVLFVRPWLATVAEKRARDGEVARG